MKIKYLYLLLALAGIVLPLSQYVPATLDGTFSVSALFQQLFATRLVAGFAFDLAISALAGLVFITAEGVRKRVPYYWTAILGTVLIGFSFGLPFFLFLREGTTTTKNAVRP